MTTQKVDKNDDLLGVYHEWIEKIAERVDQLDVICLYEGEHDLPDNVSVYSMGKERGAGKFRYVWNFYRFALRLLRKNDLLFVHMNHRYIVLLAPFLLLFRVPAVLFKAHRAKQKWLRFATARVSRVVTYTDTSFSFPTEKLTPIGPAVNIDRFHPQKNVQRNERLILFVGRVSPVKQIENVIEMISLLVGRDVDVKLSLIGSTHSDSDKDYHKKLKALIRDRGIEDRVVFEGALPNRELPKRYAEAGFFVNLSPTGGLDKTTFEAMACGCIPVTNQETAKSFLGTYADTLFVSSANEASRRIEVLISDSQQREEIRQSGIRTARGYGLDVFIDRLINVFNEVVA